MPLEYMQLLAPKRRPFCNAAVLVGQQRLLPDHICQCVLELGEHAVDATVRDLHQQQQIIWLLRVRATSLGERLVQVTNSACSRPSICLTSTQLSCINCG